MRALADEDDDEVDDDKDDFSNRALFSSGIRSNEKIEEEVEEGGDFEAEGCGRDTFINDDDTDDKKMMMITKKMIVTAIVGEGCGVGTLGRPSNATTTNQSQH